MYERTWKSYDTPFWSPSTSPRPIPPRSHSLHVPLLSSVVRLHRTSPPMITPVVELSSQRSSTLPLPAWAVTLVGASGGLTTCTDVPSAAPSTPSVFTALISYKITRP